MDSVSCALWLATNQWISCNVHWFTSSSSEWATPNLFKLRAKCLPGKFPPLATFTSMNNCYIYTYIHLYTTIILLISLHTLYATIYILYTPYIDLYTPHIQLYTSYIHLYLISIQAIFNYVHLSKTYIHLIYTYRHLIFTYIHLIHNYIHLIYTLYRTYIRVISTSYLAVYTHLI